MSIQQTALYTQITALRAEAVRMSAVKQATADKDATQSVNNNLNVHNVDSCIWMQVFAR